MGWFCEVIISLKIIIMIIIIVYTITSVSVILEILRMDTSVEYLLYSITLIYPMSFSRVAGIIQSRYSIVCDFDLRFFANSELYPNSELYLVYIPDIHGHSCSSLLCKLNKVTCQGFC